MLSSNSPVNYMPTEQDLKTPRGVRAALQQVLKQHYELADAHAKLQAAHAQTLAQVQKLAAIPPPMGPGNSLILGIPVTPVDTNSLATGASVKWDKPSGSWKVS